MDWLRTIAPLSRHGLTASACLVGALGMSSFALAAEAPIAPLTEQELAAESYQVDFKPPASGDKAKEKGDKKEAEHREEGKRGEHAKHPEHGKRGEHAKHRGHGKPGEHAKHRGHGKPGMHHAQGGHRGMGGHSMHGMAMHHGFGQMHGGFGPGHGKLQHGVGSHGAAAHGMQGSHMALMHQQMQIKALEQKVERLANAIRGDKPQHHPGGQHPGHDGAGMHGMSGISNPAVAIQRLMAENAQLKQKVSHLENALKSDKPAAKNEEAQKEEAARRPDAAGPRGPMMRGNFGGFPGRGFEGPRGPIARGPRDGQRPQMGPRDGERPQAGPRDGERREHGERDGDKKENDRRSENSSESREGFALDTNGDGFNDSPAAVVAIDVAVVDAE